MTRASFIDELRARTTGGGHSLLLAPIGAGKTFALSAIRAALLRERTPHVFVDLFTSASTPEHLVASLVEGLRPHLRAHTATLDSIAAEAATDRHHSSGALLRLFDLLSTKPATAPFVWLIDEVTEIRSLAYFPDLAEVEKPLANALNAAHGVIATSSYPALATDLFPGLEARDLPGLSAVDLETPATFQAERGAIGDAISLTRGFAATLLPLATEVHESRDAVGSLARLLAPGAPLELICRRHYEVMLLRSRGYAVSKRAAEVVAGAAGLRLTDLFPLIGRTPGASRQYLRWLVEVGLLTQIRKRYDFADPVLGIWAALYLGRPEHPTSDEIRAAVDARLAKAREPIVLAAAETEVDDEPEAEVAEEPAPPKKRIDRFEEID